MKRNLTGYMVRATDDGVTFLASSPNKALDGWSIPTEAWDTEYFDRIGAPLMYGHDYTRPPIGRVTSLTRTNAGLVAETQFDVQDPFAAEILRKIKTEFLNCCSVGFNILESEKSTVKRASLMELSVVPLPSDSHAIVLARSAFEADAPFEPPHAAGGIAIDDPASTPPNPDPDPLTARASWPETAASMVRLFRPYVQGPDSEREADYRRLAREYGRHGKTPPEALTVAEVDALSVDDIRGLFLEGEPELHADAFAAMETRAGAVLSTRNQEDLQRASDLILGVLARAKKEAETTENTDEERAAEAVARAVLTRLKG